MKRATVGACVFTVDKSRYAPQDKLDITISGRPVASVFVNDGDSKILQDTLEKIQNACGETECEQ